MPLPIGTDHPLERTPWATISIIIVTVISQYLDFGTGEWLLPVPLFQHADLFHIFFNMLFLWIFGSYLEVKIGWLKFILFYFLSELGSEFVASVLMGQDGIGASGAISGIMALYLARFYHAKIRTVFWFGPFPLRYDLPVMFLIPFWFAKDLAYGVYGMTEVTNIGYFAHVGGFLTGLVIAKVMKFDVEGRSEHFKLKAAGRLESAEEVPKALPELQRALAENYDDPEIHLLLAQYYSRYSDKLLLARKYYLQAIDKFNKAAGDPLISAGVFLEMVRKCPVERELEEYLQYAVVLEETGDHEKAALLLSQVVDRDDLRGETGKKILARLTMNAREADKTGLVEMAEQRFRELFPGIEIPKKTEKVATPLILPSAQEQVGKGKIAFWTWLNEMMNTRVFWFWWAIIFLPVAIFVDVSLMESIGDASFAVAILVPTILSATATHFYLNTGEVVGGLFFGMGYRKSELQARRDFNIHMYFNKGMASETEGGYLDSVAYYKAVLEEDSNHIEARFRLARIYHKFLERKGSATHEYEQLLEILPDGASYSVAAKTALAELRGERPAPEPIKPLEWKG